MTRKRCQPIIVVGDTLRRVKRATDDYVGSGTYKWEVLQGGVVCASAGYILYSRSGNKPYSRAASLFVFDHVCLCEQVRACLSLITFVCASRCEPTFTVVVVASPSHAIASLWSKTNCTYTSRITAIQASQVRLSLSRTLSPPSSWSWGPKEKN